METRTFAQNVVRTFQKRDGVLGIGQSTRARKEPIVVTGGHAANPMNQCKNVYGAGQRKVVNCHRSEPTLLGLSLR
jgi:hypothetical protein